MFFYELEMTLHFLENRLYFQIQEKSNSAVRHKKNTEGRT